VFGREQREKCVEREVNKAGNPEEDDLNQQSASKLDGSWRVCRGDIRPGSLESGFGHYCLNRVLSLVD
jgi:hypothetical protein